MDDGEIWSDSQGLPVGIYVHCIMYLFKLYFLTIDTWLQRNLSQDYVHSQSEYIEKQYILIYTPIIKYEGKIRSEVRFNSGGRGEDSLGSS